jgi:hypothetical protein
MANEFVRSQRKAKGKAIRFDTQSQTNVFEITAASSGGTVNTVATSPASLNVTLNGTSYRIALHS